MIDIKPLGTGVYLRVEDRPSETKGGLIIPESATGRPNRGTVIAVGLRSQLRKGDEVLFDPYKLDIVFERGEYTKGLPATPAGNPGDTAIIREEAIIAIL